MHCTLVSQMWQNGWWPRSACGDIRNASPINWRTCVQFELLIKNFDACCVCIGTDTVEIKTEADSNDVIECPPDGKPTIGMLCYSDAIFSALNCWVILTVNFLHQFVIFASFFYSSCLYVACLTKEDQYFVHNFHKFKSRINVIFGKQLCDNTGWPKKLTPYFVRLTSSNWFFKKLFHCQYQEKICNNTVTKNPTTPQMCHYTTLWNVKCLSQHFIDCAIGQWRRRLECVVQQQQELIIEMRNPNVTWRIMLPVYLFTTELRHTCSSLIFNK